MLVLDMVRYSIQRDALNIQDSTYAQHARGRGGLIVIVIMSPNAQQLYMYIYICNI